MNSAYVSGCLLAGGKSKRFGEDKRFYRLNKKTLIEISIEKLRKFFDRIYIICDEENLMKEKIGDTNSTLHIIEDIKKYRGPLTGIYSFFKKTSENSGFFIPCDMPYLPLKFIKYLNNVVRKFSFRKIILISEEKPLPIFMNSSFLPELENYLKNQNSIKGFIKLVKEKCPDRIYFIPERKLFSFGNPEVYIKNINIKEDLV